jgi:hypothetical protein
MDEAGIAGFRWNAGMAGGGNCLSAVRPVTQVVELLKADIVSIR